MLRMLLTWVVTVLGLMHVTWGIDGIDQNEMRGDGPSTSPYGYKTASIEPSNSHGIYFQLAEGDHS